MDTLQYAEVQRGKKYQRTGQINCEGKRGRFNSEQMDGKGKHSCKLQKRQRMKKGKGTGVRQKHREKKERERVRKRKQDKIEKRGEI